ncbi:MAG: trypsin-like peptidase domain-containing protein [Pirellulales bacterium]
MVRNNGAEQLGGRGDNPFKGTPFEDMFPDMPRGGAQGRVPQKDGVGSGVIISTDGVVLTNNHVVADADEVTVLLADGREFVATDIKTDPDSDLAVLRLKDAKDLVAAPIGDSDQLEIGDWVIAIGNPFELESTVSAGIISGKGRELGMIRRAKFLQTDAAINPGNSGGPLLNLDGEIVGINTAIASNTGSFNGIGFAIPANHAKWVAAQLTGKGVVERGYLGVGVSQLTPDLARKWNVRPNQGVVVGEVKEGTPAADAGIQEGDVILSVNGHVVATPRDLQEQVERLPFNAKQSIAVLRDGKTMTIGTMIKRSRVKRPKCDR